MGWCALSFSTRISKVVISLKCRRSSNIKYKIYSRKGSSLRGGVDTQVCFSFRTTYIAWATPVDRVEPITLLIPASKASALHFSTLAGRNVSHICFLMTLKSAFQRKLSPLSWPVSVDFLFVPKHSNRISLKIYNCLDEYAMDGTQIGLNFEGVKYSNIYQAMLNLIEDLKANPYHNKKWQGNRKWWAMKGWWVQLNCPLYILSWVLIWQAMATSSKGSSQRKMWPSHQARLALLVLYINDIVWMCDSVITPIGNGWRRLCMLLLLSCWFM